MRSSLASFYGLVGERDSFLAESQRALESTDINPWALQRLATVHAKLGESERAVELLRRMLRSGRVEGHWRVLLRMAGVSPDSPPYDQFREEYEVEHQRLLEMY